MLKDLLTHRLFMGALAFFVLMAVGGTLYLKPVERQIQQEISNTEDTLQRLNELKTDTTWPGEPHTAKVAALDIDVRLATIAKRLGMPSQSTFDEITAEVERREAEAAENVRLLKETNAIASTADEVVASLVSDSAEVAPILSMTYDEFHDTYPTVKDRREVAAMFMRFEEHRESFVSLIENASPPIREMMYAEIEAQGTLEQYQWLLKPLPIVDWMDDLIAEHAEPNGGISK